MAQVDLHLHTTHSDGTLTPSQLVRLCAERGLKVISISDHDSTEGIREALETASEYPEVTIIPGVELSTDVPGSEIHVLGYFVDPLDEELQATLRGFREGRQERARNMVDTLREQGVVVSWERVKELSDGGSIGRPHIAQALVEAGYVRYPRESFDRYLGRSGTAYAERVKLTPADAVRILVGAGALPVMAHPTYSVSKSDRDEVASIRQTLVGLKEAGLVGMEVYYSDYTPEQVRWLAGLADELGLVPCGGSDYHASGNPDEPEPGSVGPPMSTIDALTALRSSGEKPSDVPT
jgi:predicted metal-dependent phosphoesterase TrpH